MDENNVISLSTGEPVTLIKQKDKWCQSRCLNVLVDPHLRKLTCRECGADVEIFAWVLRMAMTEQQLLCHIKHLESESATREKRLHELKCEEQRVKARIRGAKDGLLKSAGI